MKWYDVTLRFDGAFRCHVEAKDEADAEAKAWEEWYSCDDGEITSSVENVGNVTVEDSPDDFAY